MKKVKKVKVVKPMKRLRGKQALPLPAPKKSEDSDEEAPEPASPPKKGTGSPKKESTSVALLPYKEEAVAPAGGLRISEKAKKEARVTTRADGSRVKTKTIHKEQKSHSKADGKHVETKTQQKERKLMSKADGTVTHSKSTTIKRISYK